MQEADYELGSCVLVTGKFGTSPWKMGKHGIRIFKLEHEP